MHLALWREAEDRSAAHTEKASFSTSEIIGRKISFLLLIFPDFYPDAIRFIFFKRNVCIWLGKNLP